MKYRISEILAEKTLGAAGTETIDLNVADPISAIMFEYKNTRVAVASAGHVAQNLSKIELVDGSEVIFSLSGRQLHALDFFDRKTSPYCLVSNIIGDMQILGTQYNFGRWLWDTLLALDPKKFKNPQLKVTHNPATSDASASVHTLKVVGFMFDEKAITPSGYLSSREIESFTSGADGTYHYTDLPTDRLIRKLLIRGYADNAYPHQVTNEVRLSEDNDKRVPIDIKVSTWLKQINSLYPKTLDSLQCTLKNGEEDFYCTPSFDINVAIHPVTAAQVAKIEKYPLNEPFSLNAAAAGNFMAEVTGFNPHATFPVLFGDQDDPDDWYDLTKVGSLKARIKAGTAGTNGTVQLVVQQLKAY